ncbi:YHYH protein [Spongiimicrobium sp. 3-5]|uniref:YHYH protein n=1 Tax=Spongiimicrobium sp. 3-5 TaxID=3332596 RepID=UPI0039809A64
MKKNSIVTRTLPVGFLGCAILLGFMACSNDEDDDSAMGINDDDVEVSELHLAFAAFDTENTDIYLDGANVVIETNGLPNHTTPYWGEGNALYVAPTVATGLTPSLIPNYDGSNTLSVSANPELASSSTATNLGAIGISVSGAAIFNDQEGNGALGDAIASLDYSGGHIGPAEYHYHLEPTAFSEDDDMLIGILADGFFIYGRKCNSTGTYPTDLDESGGHTSTTQYTTEAEYHYHIENELYLNAYYIIFPGDYQGTPSNIN